MAWSRSQHVRFGSKADICTAIGHVRFSPDSGHKTAVRDLPDLMSALVPKMSALTLKTDMFSARVDVRFGPTADILRSKL
jgi:hypothetical protein